MRHVLVLSGGSALVALLALAAPPVHAGSQAFDGVWSRYDSTAAWPQARREFAAVYDVQRNRYVIFGGAGDPYPTTLFNEVWWFDLGGVTGWHLLTPAAPGPGPRHSPQWGYDAAQQRLLIFGGYGQHHPGDPLAYLDDVWQLSLDGTPTWTELFPTGTPPAGRLAGAAVYDPLRQRFVGFGGTRGLPVDTWELDLSGEPAWREVPTDSTSPPGSYGMTTVYDAVRDRMLIFGGSTSDDYWGVHNDTWALDLTTDPPIWHRLEPQGTLPTARRSGTAIYDPLRDRMVIYGGWDSQTNTTASFLGDAWALSLADPPAWSALAPTGPLPVGRDAMQAVYDPLADRMVVFGGWSGAEFLHDTESLTWAVPSSAPSMVASQQADVDAAHLTWRVQGTNGVHGAVYRRETGKPWVSLATVDASGLGSYHLDDHAVTPGGRYGYQLVVSSPRGEVFGGEVWVDVPTTATDVPPGGARAFGLDPVRPNPVAGRLAVSFALASAASARLELVDVSGRRVRSEEVGRLGAGAHRLDLGDVSSLAPGLYFLRLAQGERRATTRVVVGH